MAATDITFNSFNLNDSVYVTSYVDDSEPFKRDISIYNLARTNGAVATNNNYGTKNISVSGRIHGTSVTDLEAKIDALKLAMSVDQGNLDLGYNGGTRRYPCIAAVVKVDRPVRAAVWADFNIDFTALNYGSDTSATSLYSSNITTTAALSVNVGGSAPDQFLRVQITLTTVTPATTNTIYVRNPTTGLSMSITRTWLQTDVLIIDSLNQSVKVNGTEVDYTGAFPIYGPGNGQILQIDSDFNPSTHVDTITASGNWTAPANYYQVTVEAWGGGAAGLYKSSVGVGGGAGGAGGCYASSLVSVIPSTVYPVVVGAGGTSTTSTSTVGGDSSFNTSTVVAKGGTFVGIPSTAGCVGSIVYAGGIGGQSSGPAGPKSGGGGESASAGGNGNPGTNGTAGGLGGTGTAGGDGANGVSGGTDTTGGNGSIPGGGGSGGWRATSATAGGTGARGEVKVSYVVPSFTFGVVVDQIKKYL